MALIIIGAFLPTQSAGHIHTHAAEVDNHNHSFTPGDLNADGSFAAEDLALVKGVLMDVVTDVYKIDSVDCNGDYETNLVDLVRLKKHVANDVGAAPFTYELDSNDNAVITDFDNSVHGAVTIPSEIDGHKVTGIGKGAFENSDDVTSILIPNTVETIEDGAFTGCSNLMGTSLPDSITSIGDNAFMGCSSMPNIRLSEEIIEIGEGAFSFCSSLIEINIPQKVTVLNNRAFEGCSSLLFIGLPENLKEIKTYTFYGCEKLESVSIPITVVMVEDHAFDSCESLLSVVIPYETAFGSNVFANCGMLVIKGYAGSGGIDAAVNSGADFELLECGHSDYTLLYAENPTCTEGGYSGDKYCVSCGKIEQKGVEIAPSGHITEVVSIREVTCESDGFTGNTVCTVCKTTLNYGYTIEATGHYASGVEYIAVQPTCTKAGKYGTFTCEYCNEYIDGNSISPLGHSTYKIGQKDANCVEDGYTGDEVCDRKGCDYFIEGEVILKGDHFYETQNYIKATCTQNGYSGDRICTGCGHISVKGTVTTEPHTPVTNNYKAATCTENGFSGDTECLDCHTQLSAGVVLPLLGHKSVIINYVAPTCTEDGYTGDQICSVCGVMAARGNSIDKLGHKLVLKNQKDCTATESGYTGDWICETCGETVTQGRVIPANHTHTMEINNKIESTCKEPGYTGDSTCSVCGYFVKGTVEPVKSHVISVTVVSPKCAQDGYTIDECVNCDYERKYATTEALGHNWDAEWTIGKQVTCTEDGEQYKNCSRCDEKQKETIKSEGHKLGEPQNVVEATCTKTGYTGDRICSVCSETVEGEQIAKKDHSYGELQVRCYHSGNDSLGGGLDGMIGGIGSITGGTHGQLTENDYAEEYKICTDCGFEAAGRIDSGASMYDEDNTHKATCTEEGYIEYSCKYCDYSYTKTQRATGHNYSKVVTNPTCTKQGYTDYSCKRCDYEYTSDFVDSLGHDYSEEVIEATCTNQGYTTYSCNRCDYEYTSNFVEPSGHQWEYIGMDAYCHRCFTYCSHELDWESGVCGNCGKSPCPDCYSFDHETCGPVGDPCPYCGSFDHFAYTYEECPHMSGGMDDMWCDYCCIYTDHETWSCPYSSGGIPGDIWCDNCGCYTDHTTEQIYMCPAAMPPDEGL